MIHKPTVRMISVNNYEIRCECGFKVTTTDPTEVPSIRATHIELSALLNRDDLSAHAGYK